MNPIGNSKRNKKVLVFKWDVNWKEQKSINSIN